MMLNIKMQQHKKKHRYVSHSRLAASGGFTLIELMVVLAIGAIVTSIILGGFASVGANNRRTSCQVNMAQIYQALRLYTADNDNQVPPYDPAPEVVAGSDRGIGLWELHAFPLDVASPTNRNTSIAPVGNVAGAKPVERYLRSAKSLHCPSDYDLPASATLPAGRQSEKLYATSTTFNPDYLSYQAPNDVNNPTSASGAIPTYSSSRILTRGTTTDPDEPWKRQLRHYVPGLWPAPPIRRAPTSDTVVTWCQFHRNGPGRRNHDIVLFWDGTVHSLPVRQANDAARDIYNGTGCPANECLETWQRKPPVVE